MTDVLLYEGKVAVAIAAFCLGYRLFLRSETLYALNRVVLLLTAILPFVLPFCKITIHRTVEAAAAAGPVAEMHASVAAAPAAAWTEYITPALFALYVAGVGVMWTRTAVSVYGVYRIIKDGRRVQKNGISLVVTDRNVAPFSFMKYIVISAKDWAEGAGYIVAHEQEHVRARHTVDVMLAELVTALQWFNPAAWMWRADLKDLHEFEADRAVLRGGADEKAYQYYLIKKAVGASGYSVTNSFNHSSIKKRITMMLSEKSSLRSAWKALYMVPLMGIALASTASTVTDYVPSQPAAAPDKALIRPLIAPRAGKVSEKSAENRSLSVTDGKKTADTGKIDSGNSDAAAAPKDGHAKAHGAETPLKNHQLPGDETQNAAERELYAMNEGDAKTNQDADPKSEVKPTFQGGETAFLKYLATNIKYPKTDKPIKGIVVVSFVVDKNGKVKDVRVVRSLNKLCDDEVIRVVSASPEWIPGKKDGKPADVKMTLPVNFRYM